ncbi:putative membrane protein [Oceanobacillus limi]|uniref:Putative membrane protein n=1 Tax=Oceanobacillus limi TaxID=930131 RepID=A0A1H9YEV0_9BACI|nr:cytochrome c oxidase assembly protein [Oceanobacillus limi]SES67514.1 putative membrane protein [Oceanobacillus limi]
MLDIILDEFHFSSLWNGGIFLFICFAAIIYLFLLPQDKRHTIWKSILFLVGLVSIFVAIGSPINIIGRIEFSTHVVQLILLLFIAPVLLILGRKQKAIDQLLTISPLEKIMQFVMHPIFTLGLFIILFYGYHIPAVFDQARIDLFWNYFYMFGLFLAAIFMWLPVLSSKRFAVKRKVLYVSWMVFLMLPFCLLLWLSNESFYNLYTDMRSFVAAMELCLPPGESLSPEYFELLLPFDPVGEQKQGGIILFLFQLILWITTTIILRRRT